MKDSVVTKLALRETRGTLQPHLRANRVRFFKKCPQRFCLPLESILDVNGVIKKGHVILGFSKNGRYLISYCLKIDNDDNSPLPCYAYSLHWWEFNQHRPLVQVFMVALFDKEEINQDLRVVVAESQDESKFVVYGQIRSVKEDQSHQCYVTVCAAPSPRPCPRCQHSPLGGITEKCLKHSFVVHFKYDLLPPFPIFNPSISLGMEDTVLFNAGDFLMALRILTFDSDASQLSEYLRQSHLDVCQKEDQMTRLSSSEVCSKESNENSIPCQCTTVGVLDRYCAEDASLDHVCSVENKTFHSPKSNLTNPSKGSNSGDSDKAVHAVSTVEQVEFHGDNKLRDRHKIVSGFVNELNKIHCVKQVDEGECHSLTASQEPADGKTDQHNNHSDMVANQTDMFGDQKKECNGEQTHFDEAGDLDKETSESYLGAPCSQHQTEMVVLQSTCTSSTVVESSSSSVGNNTEHVFLPRVDSSESDMRVVDYNENYDLENPKSMPNAHCGSCEGRAGVPTLNNLTLSVLKVYTETSDDSFNELSDEFDMYDGSLPITVKASNGRPLAQIGKINRSNPNPASNESLRENLRDRMSHEQVLAVHQISLDLEQCINELIQAHEGLRENYKSLKDYDVQLVGVCPDSGVVIIIARILVYTRKRQRSASCGLPVSPSPMLQCTGFLFSWDICGGAVRILQVLDIDSYPEQRKYTKFNMAAKEASELRAKFFIPQSISSFVQAFSNHTVFSGKSLKYLRHPRLPLVLMLQTSVKM